MGVVYTSKKVDKLHGLFFFSLFLISLGLYLGCLCALHSPLFNKFADIYVWNAYHKKFRQSFD